MRLNLWRGSAGVMRTISIPETHWRFLATGVNPKCLEFGISVRLHDKKRNIFYTLRNNRQNEAIFNIYKVCNNKDTNDACIKCTYLQIKYLIWEKRMNDICFLKCEELDRQACLTFWLSSLFFFILAKSFHFSLVLVLYTYTEQ